MKIFIPIKYLSQRVPNKNFRIFNGEPLYKHTLLKFQEHDVFVDTDSHQVISEIKKDNRLQHVSAFQREKELEGHHTSVCDLIKSFINKYSVTEPICQIHVTSPFLKVNTLVDAYSYITKYDSVVSCNSYQSRFWRKEKYGFCPVNHNPLKMEQTQDLPFLYEENSCFYIFKPQVISSTGNRVGKNPFFYKITEPENLDIDVESDWDQAIRRSI